MGRDEENGNGRAVLAVLAILVAVLSIRVAIGADSEPPASEPATTALEDERAAFDLFHGVGKPADPEAAARLFERGAQAGRPISQWMLAMQYRDGHGVAKDEAKALAFTKAAAEQGVADAQTMLGWMYLAGAAGVRADPASAAKWLAAAARQGNARAWLLLADIYIHGRGVERNPETGKDLLRRAAELGDGDAIAELTSLLWYGPKEHRDIRLGRHFVERGAARGSAAAAYVLGSAYLFGAPMPRDLELAAKWIGQAAEREHQLAALWLSELYAKGLGVQRDPTRARQMLDSALATANLAAKNHFAWELAVSEDERLRNGSLAVQIMRDALEAPSARRPAYLDTLAAAYAESGDFQSAVKLQKEAIEKLGNANRGAGSDADMQSRLEDYRAGRPFREARE